MELPGVHTQKRVEHCIPLSVEPCKDCSEVQSTCWKAERYRYLPAGRYTYSSVVRYTYSREVRCTGLLQAPLCRGQNCKCSPQGQTTDKISTAPYLPSFFRRPSVQTVHESPAVRASSHFRDSGRV